MCGTGRRAYPSVVQTAMIHILVKDGTVGTA